MENNMSVFFGQIPWVVAAIAIGAAGCIALYKGKYKDYFTSSLFIKTLMWLPLYVLFSIAGSSIPGSVIFALLVGAASLYEWRRHGARRMAWYLIYFLVGSAAVPLSLITLGPRLWMAVVLASVISDVAAFFFGRAIGRHRLPDSLNSRKTVEGVAGQVVGGTVGLIITGVLFDVNATLWMGVAVGVLSAIGDLANSYTKRRLAIDNWGNTIPGHGGVMDRFASLLTVLIGFVIIGASL